MLLSECLRASQPVHSQYSVEQPNIYLDLPCPSRLLLVVFPVSRQVEVVGAAVVLLHQAMEAAGEEEEEEAASSICVSCRFMSCMLLSSKLRYAPKIEVNEEAGALVLRYLQLVMVAAPH